LNFFELVVVESVLFPHIIQGWQEKEENDEEQKMHKTLNRKRWKVGKKEKQKMHSKIMIRKQKRGGGK
jgi:hypothetical protein